MKLKKIFSLVTLLLIIVSSATIAYADSTRSWSLEHKTADMSFYGRINFSKRNGLFKSVVTYYGNISGPDRALSLMSVNPMYTVYRSAYDEVGTLMISTKNYHNGNCVKEYVASNHIISTSQYKDYLSKINVDLQFGTLYNYTTQSFSLTD